MIMNLKEISFYGEWFCSYNHFIKYLLIYPLLLSTWTERRQLTEFLDNVVYTTLNLKWPSWFTPVCAIFFPRIILYSFFLFLLIYDGLGFGSYIGFLGLGFSVGGVWGMWIGAFWVFLVGALYINTKEWASEKFGASSAKSKVDGSTVHIVVWTVEVFLRI